MKRIERTSDRIVFALGAREKTFLERLLSYYPILPDDSPRLSRGAAEDLAEAELLLQHSMREQKLELAGWLRMRLTEGEALRPSSTGWRLTLESADFERLLQVFNELRVGAWTKLGCPDPIDGEHLMEQADAMPFYAIMTLAGQFEMVLLHSMHSDDDSPAAGGSATT